MADLDLCSPTGGTVPNGASGDHAPQLHTGSALIASSDLKQYLSDLLSVTLGASRQELEAENSFLSPSLLPDTVDRCRRFLQSRRVALYAVKLGNERVEADGPIQDSGTATKSPVLQ